MAQWRNTRNGNVVSVPAALDKLYESKPDWTKVKAPAKPKPTEN